ncbi:hypothetical protein WJX72_012201 [[Myrmecia] bisecta]|uniref:Nudix hydrolase domain-containing protein n=1 Tax=[Myrmecia] bisecta TaxID=41462 RepID=A0AAW1PQ80_9CHLO
MLIIPTGGGLAKKRGAGLLICSGEQREATEEMGSVPPFKLKGEVLTKRGKGGKKHYTVFIVEVTPEDKAAYVPHLNEEHSAYQWMEVTAAMQRDDMHPVVTSLLHEQAHRPALAAQFPSVPNPNSEQYGAGLLLYGDGQVFLVLRSSSRGNNTWAVPGGDVDKDDPDMQATASSLASEELGSLPAYEVKGQILTRRGNHNNRLFTVYLCSVSSDARQSWMPQLRPEHSAFQWVEFDTATKIKNLHPVVNKAFSHENRKQLKDLGVSP